MQTQSHVNKIHLLPEHVIDQIKAGEVIDSPAGLLKELIENSIDAGATEIDLQLVENGMRKIAITDNGQGISFADLPYAFARHATSKIENFFDLNKIHSFGFRGEALASMAAVAKVSCLSSTDAETSQIVIEGGVTQIHQKFNETRPHGTQLEVTDLFFNTPVRLKFLSSQNQERNQLIKIIQYYLIAHPQIQFKVKWDEQDKTIYQAATLKKRVEQIAKHSDFQNISDEFKELRLNIFLGKQEKSKPKQFLFINQRPIQDETLKNTINYTLLNSKGSKKFDWFIFLDMPPAQLDINVHPKKTTVRFLQKQVVLSFLSHGIKKFKEQPIQSFDMNPSTERPASSETQSAIRSLPSHIPYRTEKKPDYGSVPTTGCQVLHSWNHDHIFLVLVAAKEYLIFKRDLAEFILKEIEKAQDILPLLVGETVRLANPQKLIPMKIEVEPLEGNEFLIRSLPKILYYFDFQQAIENFSNEDSALLAIMQTPIEAAQVESFIASYLKLEIPPTFHPLTESVLNQYFAPS